MPATTLAEIVDRTSLWPDNTVQYSQSGTASPTKHRPDCSGAASMAMGLPTPGENTITLVTEGHCRRIGWDQLQPGDLVMLGGPNTGGNDGHVGVVVAVHRDKGSYVLWEQSGGLGPDRNTYRLGQASRPGMVPYRSVYVEVAMPANPYTLENVDRQMSAELNNTPTVTGIKDPSGKVVAPLPNVLNQILAAVKGIGAPSQEQVNAAVKAALLDPEVRAVLVQTAKEGANLAEDS